MSVLNNSITSLPPYTLAKSPVVARLVGLAITLVETGQKQMEEELDQQPTEATRLFVDHLLSAPGLVAVLPAAACERLLRPPALRALLAAARGSALHGAGAAALLGNLAQLALGAPGGPPPAGAGALLALPAAPRVADRVTAAAFCAAALALLPAAAARGAPGAAPPLARGAAAVVQAQLGLLAAQAPLLQLLGVLGDELPLFAGYALHLLQDLPALDALLAAAAGAGGQAEDLKGTQAAAGQQAAGALPGAGGAAAALNTLAFAPAALPALWRWLSLNLGVPLEAPAAARLGLDVASVAGGCRRLAPEHALVLGVFCRWGPGARGSAPGRRTPCCSVDPAPPASLPTPTPATPALPRCRRRALCQLLLVLSDDDLHVRGEPFGPAAARAIATSLNALVYHTHFPKPAPAPPTGQQQRQRGGAAQTLPAATLRAGGALLERFAPAALRGLYERDQRRPFCQPALWTAPYDCDAGQGGVGGGPPAGGGGAAAQQQPAQHSGLRAVAAVVPGLLFGGSAGGGGGGSGAAADGGGGAPAAALAAVAAGAPTAMTALLRAAPQCVPFDVRLQLFRCGGAASGRVPSPAAPARAAVHPNPTLLNPPPSSRPPSGRSWRRTRRAAGGTRHQPTAGRAR
jgi:hypothetical protein